MKPNLTFPIVGMHFRPPAGTIVRNLPVNTELTLRAEPTNQFDSNAIAVFINLSDIPLEKLPPNTTIPYNNGEVQLGYIPAVDAANLSFDRTKAIRGLFVINTANKPAVKMVGWKTEDENQ